MIQDNDTEDRHGELFLVLHHDQYLLFHELVHARNYAAHPRRLILLVSWVSIRRHTVVLLGIQEHVRDGLLRQTSGPTNTTVRTFVEALLELWAADTACDREKERERVKMTTRTSNILNSYFSFDAQTPHGKRKTVLRGSPFLRVSPSS